MRLDKKKIKGTKGKCGDNHCGFFEYADLLGSHIPYCGYKRQITLPTSECTVDPKDLANRLDETKYRKQEKPKPG